MNSKKVYMNRFHKLLCKHCIANIDGVCHRYVEPLPVCYCRHAEIYKKKYEVIFTFGINDKLKSVKIVWK
nr:MAG TPA: hypothetical protein [Caudoviricetes sp.]